MNSEETVFKGKNKFSYLLMIALLIMLCSISTAIFFNLDEILECNCISYDQLRFAGVVSIIFTFILTLALYMSTKRSKTISSMTGSTSISAETNSFLKIPTTR